MFIYVIIRCHATSLIVSPPVEIKYEIRDNCHMASKFLPLIETITLTLTLTSRSRLHDNLL